MKRSFAIGFLSLVAMGVIYLASCSEPLEVNNSPSNNPPARVDTVFIFDTLTPSDSALRIDTVRIYDTIRTTDTTVAHDTIQQIDTTIRFDTIHIIDPHYIHDTVTMVDTVTETTTVIDTLIHTDTVTHVDTVTVTHTVVHYDTVVVNDTLTTIDTIIAVDTITSVDTVVRVDTVQVGPVNCEPEPFCGKLSSCDKDLVWMFRNAAGDYRLEFSGYAEKDQPLQTIVVNINGKDYYWQAATTPLWIKELTLSANTIIKIKLTSPPAYGHAISICLNMTKI